MQPSGYINSALQCLHRFPVFSQTMVHAAVDTSSNSEEDIVLAPPPARSTRGASKRASEDKDSDTTTTNDDGANETLLLSFRAIMAVLTDPARELPGYIPPSFFTPATMPDTPPDVPASTTSSATASPDPLAAAITQVRLTPIFTSFVALLDHSLLMPFHRSLFNYQRTRMWM
jgi:hypothetical protein